MRLHPRPFPDFAVLALTLALALFALAGPPLHAQPGSGPISGGGGGGGLPGASEVTESMLKVVNACTDEYVLTCETTTGDFEWQPAATGTIGGSTGALDNAILAADGVAGATLQTRAITISDVAGFIVTLASTPGNALALGATAPAATTGASQTGKGASLTASDAVASTDTAGAAAGGSVTITAGAAARLTSGNANGGDVTLSPGTGIGTGTRGRVKIGTAGAALSDSNADGRMDFFAGGANQMDIVDVGGGYRLRFFGVKGLTAENVLLDDSALVINSDTGIARVAAGVLRVTDASTGIRGLLGGGTAIASATALPVPTGRVFHVTGTTTITSITSTNFQSGVCVTLIFDGILTFTDGSNLVLAGNFVTTAADTITVCYDGTNWHETGRSIN